MDFQSIPNINSEKDIKVVKDYLYTLTEQMKYQMYNLGEENMNAEFLNKVMTGADGSVAQLSMTSEALGIAMQNAENDILALQLTASGLTLALSNNKLVFDEKGLTVYNSGITADSGKIGGWTLGKDGFFGTNTYMKASPGGNVYARFGYMYFGPNYISFGNADPTLAASSIYLDETLTGLGISAANVNVGINGGTVVLGAASTLGAAARIIINGKDLTAKLAAL